MEPGLGSGTLDETTAHGTPGDFRAGVPSRLCRGRDSNPHGPFGPGDFKSPASTDFATPAEMQSGGCLISAPAHLNTRAESGKRDSNPRPQPWQGCALPTELFPRILKYRASRPRSQDTRTAAASQRGATAEHRARAPRTTHTRQAARRRRHRHRWRAPARRHRRLLPQCRCRAARGGASAAPCRDRDP